MLENLTEIFVPKKLRFRFGDVWCFAEREWNKFVCNKELEEDLECDKIMVLDIEDKIIETISREIKLNKWDTLHFEYSIDVKFW